jgi:hypothetical protein
MKEVVWIVILVSVVTGYGCGRMNGGTTAASSAAAIVPVTTTPSPKVDFKSQIKPFLEARCQPCHFTGGKVYAKMPFDRPETIKTLGTKLFTRIKDENERRLIRDFLAQE